MTSECADFNDTVALDTLLRHVIPTINRIPYDLGLELLRQAYQDFARRSEMLANRHYIYFQKDVPDYELTPPDGYEIYKVRGMERGPEYLATPNVNYWYVGWGVRFYIVGNNRVVFKDVPSADDQVNPYSIITTVVPNECVLRIPREISVSFGGKIAKKALAEALRYKSKPWYDPELSKDMRREYEQGVQSARQLVISNRGAASMTARARRIV